MNKVKRHGNKIGVLRSCIKSLLLSHKTIRCCNVAVLGLLGTLATVQAADTRPSVSTPLNASQLNARLDRIERLLESKTLLEMYRTVEQLQAELNALRGQLELQGHDLELIKSRQRDLFGDMDNRLHQLETTRASDSPSVPPTMQNTPATDTLQNLDLPKRTQMPLPRVDSATVAEDEMQMETPPLPTSTPEDTSEQQLMRIQSQPEEAADEQTASSSTARTLAARQSEPAMEEESYQQAFELLKDRSYNDAAAHFREFLVTWPDSAYSDNAQYWLAESHYAMHQFQQAIREYETLLNTYPQSPKLTHAMLKIAYSYQALGDGSEAKQRLQKLVDNYPGTTAARMALERINTLNY